MASRGPSKNRPVFHLIVLSSGFVAGRLTTELARMFLPTGSIKDFLTTAVSPSLGPLSIDLVISKFAVGPVSLDVSVLSLVGVLIAYLIARSLF